MPMKKFKPEQIVTLLRQVEVELAKGKTTPQAYKEAQIIAQKTALHYIIGQTLGTIESICVDVQQLLF